jgi:hypothetical protein
MTDDLKQSQLRAIQYFYVDGTFEFSFGGLCLLLAIYFYFQAILPESLLATLLNMAFILVVLGASFLINRLVHRLKEHLTYPRTGFVAYRPKYGLKLGVRIAIGLTLGFLFSTLIIIGIKKNPNVMDWMPGITGLFFGIVLAWIGFRSALPRFYLVALAIFVTGIGLAVSGIGYAMGLALVYGLTSLVLFISGSLTLWTYLRKNPEKVEEQP